MKVLNVLNLRVAAVIAGAVAATLCTAHAAYAQGRSFSVTITPSLFQLSIGPGESWTSAVKVVNSNSFDADFFIETMDFEANGEDGSAKYMPVISELSGGQLPFSLASWVTLGTKRIHVRSGESVQVPFSLHIPENAEPGGHYAAILVGTNPPEEKSGGSFTKISSFVSSLLFVKISGDIIEEGRIREFSTKESLYQEPKTDFTLRFENTGNTHLKPQGDIAIYNMWGKERGKISINTENGNFGNVLPKSIRKFQFSWDAESSPFDIGHYSAVVTLAFGENGRKNVVAKTYFWVIPTGPVVVTLSIIFAFIALITWFIRRYIRRALELERNRLNSRPSGVSIPEHGTLRALIEPIREGVIDLKSMRSRSVASQGHSSFPSSSDAREVPLIEPTPYHLNGEQFGEKYRAFFLFVAVVLCGATLTWWYLSKAVEHREYRIHEIRTEEEASPL